MTDCILSVTDSIDIPTANIGLSTTVQQTLLTQRSISGRLSQQLSMLLSRKPRFGPLGKQTLGDWRELCCAVSGVKRLLVRESWGRAPRSGKLYAEKQLIIVFLRGMVVEIYQQVLNVTFTVTAREYRDVPNFRVRILVFQPNSNNRKTLSLPQSVSQWYYRNYNMKKNEICMQRYSYHLQI